MQNQSAASNDRPVNPDISRSPDACIASPDRSASGVATSSLSGLLTAIRAAALVAAPAPAAGPLSGSYLCLYATFTVLTSMDTFRNLYALFVV